MLLPVVTDESYTQNCIDNSMNDHYSNSIVSG